MNIYIVVEGETGTKRLYKNWIPLVNNKLQHINYLDEFNYNNFFILAGFGQPFFFDRVEHAVEDVDKLSIIDRLVIGVDSENVSLQEKYDEVKTRIDRIGCRVEVRYIIQHFCLETWLLGNRKVFRKKPQDEELLSYLARFNIRINDPELLPNNDDKSWNRAQFSYHYLRAGIRDTYGNRKSYSKKNPGVAVCEGYFNQVRSRCLTEQHIRSFFGFMDAFV